MKHKTIIFLSGRKKISVLFISPPSGTWIGWEDELVQIHWIISILSPGRLPRFDDFLLESLSVKDDVMVSTIQCQDLY